MAQAEADTRSPMMTFGGAAMALAAGVFAVFLHREPASLGPSGACPGLAEALSIAGAALAPRTPLGAWIAALAAISLAIAVALTIAAARVRGVGAGPATAAGMTFGLLAMFSRRFVPPDAIAAAAAAASFLLLAGLKRSHPGSGRLVLVALALTALAAPGIGVALGVTALGVALVTERGRGAAVLARAAAYAAVPAALAWAMGLTLPALPAFAAAGASSACVAPAAMIHLGRVWPLIFGTFTGAGPYAVALAALGAFSAVSTAARIERWPVYALAILPLLVAGPSTVDSARAAIPFALGFWLLAAGGLQQLVLACRRGVGGRVAAVLFVILLPGFRVARPPDPVALDETPAGQSTLSVDAFRRVLGILPARSVLVQEDALTDMLLRATWRTRQRSGKVLELADRNSTTLRDVAKDDRLTVIALPSAQIALRDQGFHLSTVGTSGASGLAHVTPGAECAPVARIWQDETRASATGEIAIVAADANARGPLVLYASSATRPQPHPIDWPGATARGFSWGLYDRLDEASEQKLERDLADDDLTLGAPAVSGPFVERLEMWRTPDAPARLASALGAAGPAAATARLTSSADDQRLLFCSRFPYSIGPIQMP